MFIDNQRINICEIMLTKGAAMADAAAAHAIAASISADELHAEYVVPSVFDKRIAEAVARAVDEAAHRTGVARRGN